MTEIAIKKGYTNSKDYTVHQNVGVGLHPSSFLQEINNSICDEDEHGDKSKSLRRKTMQTCKLPWPFFVSNWSKDIRFSLNSEI